jgi:hypothetical protein
VIAVFGGPEDHTTWDGEPVSRDRPNAATVVVAAEGVTHLRYRVRCR